jgi:hypothetical protein
MLPGNTCILEGVHDRGQGKGKGPVPVLLISHNIATIWGRGGGRLASEGVKNGIGSELFSADW